VNYLGVTTSCSKLDIFVFRTCAGAIPIAKLPGLIATLSVGHHRIKACLSGNRATRVVLQLNCTDTMLGGICLTRVEIGGFLNEN
jgi:hypothetical protein